MSIHHCLFHHCFCFISFIAKNKTKKIFNFYMKHNGHNFLIDSTVSPKVKITKGQGIGVRSLAHNISRLEGHVGALGWGLGRMINESIIHLDLDKPNNKLANVWLEHFWCKDKPRAITDSQDSPWLRLGGSHHLPHYNILYAWPWGMHPNVILSWDSQVESLEIFEIGILASLEA
jgi:hypothetical protein